MFVKENPGRQKKSKCQKNQKDQHCADIDVSRRPCYSALSNTPHRYNLFFDAGPFTRRVIIFFTSIDA